MSIISSGPLERTRLAATDVYDEERKSFLVQYSPTLVVALGILGVVALALTGFAGYAETGRGGAAHFANPVEWLFHAPWLLFFWLCALLVVLQASIFRDPTLRRQRGQMVTMTVLATALVIFGYYLRDQFSQIVVLGNALLHALDIHFHIRIEQSLLFALINYGVISFFWLSSMRRWVQCMHNQRGTTQVLVQRGTHRPVPVVTPSLAEVIAGDCIAGAALAAALWGIFQPRMLNGIVSFINTRQFDMSGRNGTGVCASNCALSDRNQMLFYLSLGLFVLALTALMNGLAALNAVEQTTPPHPIIDTDETGTEKGTEGVVDTVIDSLLAAFSRQSANAINSTGLALRGLVWPIMVVAAVSGLAVTAHFTQLYLHGMSCMHAGNAAQACDPASLAQHDWLSLSAEALFALAGLFMAGLGGTLAAAFLAYDRRVAENTLRFLELTGLVMLLTFWIFALALSGFNMILSHFVLNLTQRWPFAQPEPLTIISFLALLIYAVLMAGNRMRRGDAPLSLPIIRLTPPAVPPPVTLEPPPPYVPLAPGLTTSSSVPPMSYERVTAPEAP